MNKKRAFKITFLFIFLLIFFGVIWSCNITKTVRKNNSNSDLKDQHAIVKNIIVTETQNEKKYWEFYAKSGEYSAIDTSVKLYEVIGNFYNDEQKVVVSFKSDYGQYDEKTKEVVLYGDILFVNDTGAQLYADHIVWKGQDKDINADGNVQYIQQDKIVSKANKAIFNSTLTNFKIKEKTITKIYTNGNERKKYTQL